MQGGVGRKWSRWQPLMYLPQTVMNSPRENKPITSSRIGLVFLLPPLLFLLPSLIGRRSLLSGLLFKIFIPGPSPLSHLSLQGAPSSLHAGPNRPSIASRAPPPSPILYPYSILSFFSLSFTSFSPRLPSPSLHPSHWVMAIRAGSRPAAVGDRHWSHTQSLGAEGKAIHPFCARPCSHSWPYCTLADSGNYSRPDCRMKQIKLKGEYTELLIHYLVPLRWGLEVYIQWPFVTETGHSKLKPHTASW